jgi:hypothetical protein
MTDFTTGQWAYRGKPTEPVTILTTQRPGNRPVVSMNADGVLLSHYADGQCGSTNGSVDLVPLQTPRPPVEGWVNVYDFGEMHVHPTKEKADACAAGHRIACVFVREVEGGK